MSDAKKKRRIEGADFWAIYDLLKKQEDAQEVYKDWLRDRAREEKCYSDQIQRAETGLIVNDKGEKSRCGDAFIKEAREQQKKLRIVIEAVRSEREKLAKKYKTWPDLINEGTGEISDEDIERIEIPTDVVKEEKKKDK